MSLQNERQLANTREKLRRLEERYEALRTDEGGEKERVRALTAQSLKRLINQLKEEIARFESRQASRR